MRKLISVGLAAGLLLALMAIPAAAQDAYPPDAPRCSLAGLGGPEGVEPTVPPGGTVEIVCEGWAPNTEVTVTLFSTPVVLGTTATDGQGRLLDGFTIPADTAPGPHTLRMSGLNPQNVPTNVDLALSVADPAPATPPADPGVVTPPTAVTPPAPGVVPAPRLPRTGGDALLALGLAAGLLAAGGGALGYARRRNRAEIA